LTKKEGEGIEGGFSVDASYFRAWEMPTINLRSTAGHGFELDLNAIVIGGSLSSNASILRVNPEATYRKFTLSYGPGIGYSQVRTQSIVIPVPWGLGIWGTRLR